MCVDQTGRADLAGCPSRWGGSASGPWTPARVQAVFDAACGLRWAEVEAALAQGLPANVRPGYPVTVTLAGPSLLHFASALAHMPTLRRLLALGANPNAQDRDGQTPLHWAGSAEVRVCGRTCALGPVDGCFVVVHT